MIPKSTTHVIQGMQKDTSKSKLSKEFAFDAKNIRITAMDDNSLLSVTNEKGNSVETSFKGDYLGHCIINNQLVIFAKNEPYDVIYLYDFIKPFPSELYRGNLNFDLNNPIETLGVYENEDIQKVYWVDGINQPRVINIKGDKSKFSDSFFDFVPELKLEELVDVEVLDNASMFAPGVIQYAFSYYNKYGQESNIFNTTPLCYLSFNNRGASPEEIIRDRAFRVKISNLDTNFEYIRAYSIHRTSLNAVPTVKRIIDLPIYTPKEEEIVTDTTTLYNVPNGYSVGYLDNNGNIRNINNILDYKSENIIYNPQVTKSRYNFALDSNITPDNQYIAIIKDGNLYPDVTIRIEGYCFNVVTSTYRNTDNSNKSTTTTVINTEGLNSIIHITKKVYNNDMTSYVSFVDNGYLGETIDPTQLLYIGGEYIIAGTIAQKDNTLFLGNIKLNHNIISEELKNSIKNIPIVSNIKTIYSNSNTYNTLSNTYFKSGEHYRLGIQFQDKSGKWSSPLYISDVIMPTGKYPIQRNDSLVELPCFKVSLPEGITNTAKNYGYKRMRGVVVFPESGERLVLTQGLLCPTVYSTKNRKANSPYVQSSWFLRPYSYDENNAYPASFEEGTLAEYRHGYPLANNASLRGEIQNNAEYKVDQSILNLYSPEIEFLQNEIQDETANVKLRIVGLINFTNNYSDIDIKVKTPSYVNSALGVQKNITKSSKGFGTIAGLYYKDGDPLNKSKNASFQYVIYPWHRSGSLNTDSNSIAANDDNRPQSAILETKKLSNYKISDFNIWLNSNDIWEASGENKLYGSYADGITSVYKASSDQINLIKIKEDNEEYNYYNNIDTLETTENNYALFYSVSNDNTRLSNTEWIYSDPVRIKYKTAPHLVFKLRNNRTHGHSIILPTVNNIHRITGTVEVDTPTLDDYGALVKYADVKRTVLPTDAEIGDLCFIKGTTSYIASLVGLSGGDARVTALGLLEKTNSGWKNYEGDKAFFYSGEYEVTVYKKSSSIGYFGAAHNWKKDTTINIKPSESTEVEIKQDSIYIANLEYPFLFLAELYRTKEFVQNAFGGTSEDSIQNNIWIPASDTVNINESNEVLFTYGDTRYQRYDCLKTYAFTPEDENQVIEIASFMCETRVNMLGRYDKNIGNLSNLNADPANFNLFNPIYSQKDNFFNYRILDSDLYKLDKFDNTITWSKEKFAGENVDTWTNITMANTLDLDGTKGKVNKLVTIGDKILCFQDKGFSQILFNSRVQIPVNDGVPVEITNGYKVDGYRYISDAVGCQNKNSIVTTPSGVYFLDGESNGIYNYGEGLTNLSTQKGFDIWTKEIAKDSTFKSFYDKNNKDVYFTTKNYCLCFSEKLNQFTSFYDYNDVYAMFNLGTDFFSIKNNILYSHFTGDYNMFYGENKPYYITLISNDDAQLDKVFTNIEYRADVFSSNNEYLHDKSFDNLKVWNEYQSGESTLSYDKYKPSTLKKKFRMWRADIPRDSVKKMDRMRNPWLFIKLSNNNPGTNRIELHDIVVHYFE